MQLREIKKLSPDFAKIEKLKEFLLDCELTGSEEIKEGFLCLLELYLELKEYQAGLNFSKDLIFTRRFTDRDFIYSAARIAVELSLESKDFTFYEKFFRIKEEYIKKIDYDELLFDTFRYELNLDNQERFLNVSKEFLDASSNQKKRNFVLLKLAEYFFSKKEFKKAKEYSDKLVNNPNHLCPKEALVLDLEISYSLFEKDTFLKTTEILKEKALFSKDLLRRIVYIRLLILAEEKRYHQFFILQAQYEELFEELPLEKLRTYYEICLEAYLQKDGFSKTIFEKKLKELDKKNKEKTLLKPALPVKEEKKFEEETIIKPEPKLEKNIYEILLAMQTYSEEISYNEKYREYLRQMGIFLSEYLKIDEFVLYFPEEDSLNNIKLYNYKTDRLYESIKDKKALENSFYQLFSKKNQGFVIDLADYYYVKCPFTNKFYKEKNAQNIFIASIIHKTRGKAFLIAENKNLHFEFNSETEKIISFFLKLIHKRLKVEQVLEFNFSESETYRDIFMHLEIPLKIETNSLFLVNEAFKNLFGEINNIVDFYKIIDNSFLNLYKEKYKALENDLNYFSVNFKKQNAKTLYQEIARKTKDLRISYYLDISQEIKKRENDKNLIYLNQKYKIENEFSLREKLTGLFENSKVKFSLLLLEIHKIQDLLNFFSYEERLALNKGLLDILEENGDVYYYDENKFIVYLDYNDKRAVLSRLELLSLQAKEYFSKKYNKFSFTLDIAYLRYPLATNEKRLEKIFNFLEATLNKAKKLYIKDNFSLVEYKYDDFTDEKKREALIASVLEGIFTKQYSVKYYAVYNSFSEEIKGFYPKLEFFGVNLNPEFIYKTFAERSLVEEFDFLFITKIFEDLRKLKEIKKRMHFFIKISSESAVNKNFLEKITDLVKKEPGFSVLINLIITDYLNVSDNKALGILKDLGFKVLSDNLKDLFNNKIDGLLIKKEYLDYYEGITNFISDKNYLFITEKVQEITIKEKNREKLLLISQKFFNLDKYLKEE